MRKMTLDEAATYILETWRDDMPMDACRNFLQSQVDPDFVKSIDFFTDWEKSDEGYFVSIYPYHRFDYVCEIPVYGELEWYKLIDAIVEAYYSDPGDLVAGKYTFRKL